MWKFPAGLTLLFLSTLPSAVAMDLRPETLPGMLESVHDINWAPYANTPAEVAALRHLLQTYIDDIGGKNDESVDEKKSRQRAISEYGKFAANESGALAPDAFDFYKKLMDRGASSGDDDSERTSLLRSLGNTGTPESAELLSDWIDPSNPITSTFALGTLDQVFATHTPERDKKSDATPGFSAVDKGKAIAERRNPEAWRRAAEKISQRLTRLSEKNGGSGGFSERVLRTLSQIKAATSAIGSSTPPVTDANAALEPAKSTEIDRKAASVNETLGSEDLATKPSDYSWLLWLTAGGAFFAFRFWRRKRA